MASPDLSESGWTVRRAVVIGAGTMGAQIAALLAGFGIECELLDLPDTDGRDRRAEAALEKLAAMRPSPLFDRADLDRIRPGNVEDHCERLAECDWVIEAVFEDLAVKQRLWSTLAPHLRHDAIASTNTSSIPIHSIAAVLPTNLQSRFLGAHFFNPPRYLRLFELIPTQETDPAVTAALQRFGSETLGKGCILAHDVPGFVGNRIGLYVFADILRAMQELGLGPDEIDSVTGPPLGRPRSATFRTLDLIGIDVYVDICDKLQATVPEPWEQAAFAVPPFVRTMVERGWLGEKSGQGFYKRVEEDGRREILVLDPETLEYRSQRSLDAPSLAAVRRVEDSGARIAALAHADDAAGRLAWGSLSRLFAFAAAKIPEVADEIASIDNAMRWGFAWELGPFETWEAMGKAETADRMERDGLAVPPWVTALAQRDKPFYRYTKTGTEQATPQSTYRPVAGSERALSLPWLRAQAKPVVARAGATLYDIGDGIAFLDVHGPKQTIDTNVLDMLEIAAEQVPPAFQWPRPQQPRAAQYLPRREPRRDPPRCAGAAVGRDRILHSQAAILAAGAQAHAVPFVTALYGRALGGGLELGLSAHRIVAARESYVGLVETAVGLVPAGGGCKELLLRMLAGHNKGRMDSRFRGNDEHSAGGNSGHTSRGNDGQALLGNDTPNRHSRESGSPSVNAAQAVQRAFETIQMAKVSQHAPDAAAKSAISVRAT